MLFAWLSVLFVCLLGVFSRFEMKGKPTPTKKNPFCASPHLSAVRYFEIQSISQNDEHNATRKRNKSKKPRRNKKTNAKHQLLQVKQNNKALQNRNSRRSRNQMKWMRRKQGKKKMFRFWFCLLCLFRWFSLRKVEPKAQTKIANNLSIFHHKHQIIMFSHWEADVPSSVCKTLYA